MKRLLAALLVLSIAFPATIPGAYAQEQPVAYAQQDLERMLAPIALYPDPLLSQVLMAATYPVEVVEAARWTRANPGLQGGAAVQAVAGQDWDPSVQSLVAFPQVLQRMDENLEWTRALGDAFLAQQPQVMDTVQTLRQQALAAGNLQSSGPLVVQQQAGEIYIQPANPEVVYVPYYDPALVYYRPAVFQWGLPIAISASFFFGRPDWRRHTVRVERPVIVNRTVVEQPGSWRHDPNHRRGATYRDPAVRQRFAAAQETHRYPRPPARDLHDSRVLSPQPRPEARPQPQPQAQPQPQPRTQVRPEPQRQAQAQPRPQAQRPQAQGQRPQVQAQRPQVQVQPRAQVQAQPRPHVQPQEERRHARDEKRENHQEASQEQRQERSHARGNDRS
ncbi:MAG TPA: DUF3300 domain-containing protein [Burkholderiales bacterium]|nr:DUF3300 domain-containing protein [Burkholderiales bacterium]